MKNSLPILLKLCFLSSNWANAPQLHFKSCQVPACPKVMLIPGLTAVLAWGLLAMAIIARPAWPGWGRGLAENPCSPTGQRLPVLILRQVITLTTHLSEKLWFRLQKKIKVCLLPKPWTTERQCKACCRRVACLSLACSFGSDFLMTQPDST